MTIRIYIDTNVFLNFIQKRDNNISENILLFLEANNIDTFVNDLSIVNIHYITRKSISRADIKKEIENILDTYNLVSINKEIILKSLNSNFKDFEDAIQYFCAKKVGADLIITSNIKDFQQSDIKVITPIDFFNNYIR